MLEEFVVLDFDAVSLCLWRCNRLIRCATNSDEVCSRKSSEGINMLLATVAVLLFTTCGNYSLHRSTFRTCRSSSQIAIRSSPRQIVLSLANQCESLLQTISQQIAPIPVQSGRFIGKFLTSRDGCLAIAALAQPERNSIADVPVDKRSFCRQVLVNSIKRPGVKGRRDLVCTVAQPGSGKTVVLWFNLYWFLTETQGIAVDVTFNSDQSVLYAGSGVKSADELELAISVRIIHRLIEHISQSKKDADRLCKDGGIIVGKLLTLSNPLDCTLQVVRSLLGASSDTKFLLCVDELSKCVNPDGRGLSTAEALKVLTRRLDSDETFFLAVSALTANDVVRLSTDSNRHLLLQALGPLWFTEGFNPAMIPLLPEALQPFYNADARLSLPYDVEAQKLYDELTQLLATAAGHPRRMEVLFMELRKFTTSQAASAVVATSSGAEVPPPDRQRAGKLFVKELAEWLHLREDTDPTMTVLDCIEESVKGIVALPTDYSLLLSMPRDELIKLPVIAKDDYISIAMEELSEYCASPFTMPHSTADKERMKIVLKGVSEGFCQLVSVSRKQILAFIPMPVLDGRRPRQLLPRGQALFALRDAIREMNKSKRGQGSEDKDLEEVAVAALLMFARCRSSFTLRELCEAESYGAGLSAELEGGINVILTTMEAFPARQREPITAAEVQTLVDQLHSSGASGMIIKVRNKWNIPGDFYGLFRTTTGSFAGFRVQCKDWFRDDVYDSEAGRKVDMVSKWRKHDRLFPPEIVLNDGAIVPFASLLFTSNQLQRDVKVKQHEGIITIAAMRTWLPTAAHALQTVNHLREIFGWYRGAQEAKGKRKATRRGQK